MLIVNIERNAQVDLAYLGIREAERDEREEIKVEGLSLSSCLMENLWSYLVVYKCSRVS